MQSSNRIPLLVAFFAVILLAAVFYYTYESGKKHFIWTDSWARHGYNEKSEQPYGTLVFHRLLESVFPGRQCTDIRNNIKTELPSDPSGGSVYVFVGETLYLDSIAAAQLTDFVAAGNTAFIASKNTVHALMPYLYGDPGCNDWSWDEYASFEDSSVSMTLRAPLDSAAGGATFHFAVQNKPESYAWQYIETGFFCDSMPHFPIGYVNDTLINFAAFPFGKGRFLLHTNPLVFTNYHLLRPGTRRYVASALSWIPEGNIYWDAASRIGETSGPSETENPLLYILQQPALAWAWYLLLGLAFTWLVFRAKRRQRIIPVLPKNENSSYEFIGTIANLHFREKNYRGLCVQNTRLFLAQVRERYCIPASLDPENLMPRVDDAFFRRLSAVSETPEYLSRNVFNQYSATVQFEPTEEMMVDLHLAMEDFWRKAK